MQKEQVLTDLIKENNVIPFTPRTSLITGGPTKPENWLKELNKGTVFLARRRNDKELILNKYLMLEHKVHSTNLVWGMPDNRQIEIWVPTLEFSRQYELNEVIAEVELVYNEEETGADNASTVEPEIEGLGALPDATGRSEEGEETSPDK